MNFPKLLYDVVPKLPRTNLKDWSGFYATDAGKNLRDLYWRIIGEPQTNPMDFMGCFNTTAGEAMEEKLAEKWFSKLGPYGLYLYDSQIYLGEKDPVPWSGRADFLFLEIKDGKQLFYLKEMKTAYGMGGEWILNKMTPKEDQAAQLALYLRCLHNKGKKVEHGSLTYFIFGNNAQTRTVIEFLAKYNPEDNTVKFFKIVLPNEERPYNYVVHLDEVFKDWQIVLDHVAKGELPPETHQYKYTVTPAMIDSLSDNDLLKAIDGAVVHGDWQIGYSSYKDKHLQLTKDKPFYSIQEIQMFEAEYKKRHPKTRRF